LGIFGLPLKGI